MYLPITGEWVATGPADQYDVILVIGCDGSLRQLRRPSNSGQPFQQPELTVRSTKLLRTSPYEFYFVCPNTRVNADCVARPDVLSSGRGTEWNNRWVVVQHHPVTTPESITFQIFFNVSKSAGYYPQAFARSGREKCANAASLVAQVIDIRRNPDAYYPNYRAYLNFVAKLRPIDAYIQRSDRLNDAAGKMADLFSKATQMGEFQPLNIEEERQLQVYNKIKSIIGSQLPQVGKALDAGDKVWGAIAFSIEVPSLIIAYSFTTAQIAAQDADLREYLKTQGFDDLAETAQQFLPMLKAIDKIDQAYWDGINALNSYGCIEQFGPSSSRMPSSQTIPGYPFSALQISLADLPSPSDSAKRTRADSGLTFVQSVIKVGQKLAR